MRVTLAFLILMMIGCSNQKKENGIETKSDFEKYDELVWSGMLNFKDKNYENSLSDF
ncbi:hypothetical protein [Aequorivita ciconiae]|uniref:hypothetical protein n=1 Tax=Aequorivita ciconiae TaxID=2494375 RepID=UPI0013E29BFA|nr:hypothetical protein [Aequorivita sp. H23M31]